MKILVIGEKCEDVFVYGDTNRLSPEAPVPVFIPKYTKRNDGMAANVVRNLEKITQDDDFTITGHHQKNNIIKTRYIDDKSNHPFIRVDEFEDTVERIVFDDKLEALIKEADCVIVSDYDKGFLDIEDLHFISDNSKFCILDTKKKLDSETIRKFDFVKLNEYEFKTNYTEDSSLLEKIIITLGSKGAKHKDMLYPSESPRETIDVSGAGDTFTAAFAKKFLQLKDVSIAISYANKMANLVIHKRGVETP
jgi:bifunctional ADP-heptose synthase (sugar kinase/adenylyltransferase)